MDYDNLTDDEILEKMAEIDWDIWETEQKLRDLRDVYSQAQRIADREQSFSAVRSARGRNRSSNRPSFR